MLDRFARLRAKALAVEDRPIEFLSASRRLIRAYQAAGVQTVAEFRVAIRDNLRPMGVGDKTWIEAVSLCGRKDPTVFADAESESP